MAGRSVGETKHRSRWIPMNSRNQLRL
ncbi:uncharacterized protein METZ01_LOCUS508817, partial [marine metagenome]